ncbi:hypothetical protein [Haloterrigena salifodinae]|uniref:hypothetical protein n=1 Tax=Haloterrigena salifodinae TaxID=2675099 RepID=UPI000F870736|nr:hypothetical protein [Haloterrigena salifodinae]
MSQGSILQTGFYIVIGVAGISAFSDAILSQTERQVGSIVALMLMIVGGILLSAISISGIVGLTPAWFTSIVDSLPRLEAVGRFNQRATVSMLILLLFIVLPRWYLNIDGSLLLEEVKNVILTNGE